MEQKAGDYWTWTAIAANSKIISRTCLGNVGAGAAYAGMQYVASRIGSRIQRTTDGHRTCRAVVRQRLVELGRTVCHCGARMDEERREGEDARGVWCPAVKNVGMANCGPGGIAIVDLIASLALCRTVKTERA